MTTFGGEGGFRPTARQIRGPGSWVTIWGSLGFSIAIEGTFIQLITPLEFPLNVFLYIAIGALTVLLFSRSWFQTWLLGIKKRFEERPR
jgi:predicted membrane channel-forming protein YqfA (hemolysin III family)